jgi:acid phosphatase family membrane protein YuiD
VLNILLEDVIQGHPVTEQRLKEVLGHTPLQVGGPCPHSAGLHAACAGCLALLCWQC